MMPKVREICLDLNIEAARYIGLSTGASDSMVELVSTIENSCAGSITFLGKALYDHNPDITNKIKSTLLILDETLQINYDELAHSGVKAVILSASPRYDFIRVLNQYFSPKRPTGIHPTVVLAENAIIGSDVFVGPYCVIGEKSSIGDGSTIHSGVHIYDNVRVMS